LACSATVDYDAAEYIWWYICSSETDGEGMQINRVVRYNVKERKGEDGEGVWREVEQNKTVVAGSES
jgi:hypothetical protein